MLGFLIGALAFASSLGLGVAGVAVAAMAERAEREGAARAEVRGFLGVVDRLGLGQRIVVVTLIGWGLVLASPVWLWLGLRSLLGGGA